MSYRSLVSRALKLVSTSTAAMMIRNSSFVAISFSGKKPPSVQNKNSSYLAWKERFVRRTRRDGPSPMLTFVSSLKLCKNIKMSYRSLVSRAWKPVSTPSKARMTRTWSFAATSFNGRKLLSVQNKNSSYLAWKERFVRRTRRYGPSPMLTFVSSLKLCKNIKMSYRSLVSRAWKPVSTPSTARVTRTWSFAATSFNGRKLLSVQNKNSSYLAWKERFVRRTRRDGPSPMLTFVSSLKLCKNIKMSYRSLVSRAWKPVSTPSKARMTRTWSFAATSFNGRKLLSVQNKNSSYLAWKERFVWYI